MQAYTVCIGVTLECRWMKSEMIGDGQGHADKADKAYHDRTDIIPSCQDLCHAPENSSVDPTQ